MKAKSFKSCRITHCTKSFIKRLNRKRIKDVFGQEGKSLKEKTDN